MKFLKSNNVSNKLVRTPILLLGFITLGLFSCSDDDNDVTMATDEQEAESGFIFAYRFQTDQGRVWYMSAHPEIPSEPDVENSVELGFNAQIYSYRENVFTWNGDASAMTKWEVDRTTFEIRPVAVLSFAQTGISGGYLGPPVFISETRAYYTLLLEGAIVEWNPSTMEIIEAHQVEPNPLGPLVPVQFTSEWWKYIRNDKLIMPIAYNELAECCDFDNPNGAMVAVFDLNTKTIEYIQDDRLLVSEDNFILDENDDMYVVPGWSFFVREYFDVDTTNLPNQFSMLKFNDDGTFDPNFEINFEEIFPSERIQVSHIFGNSVVVNYYDTSYTLPPNWDDRFSLFDQEVKWATVDLTTKEVQPFNAFDNYNFVIEWTEIDGVSYFLAGGDETIDFIRQDGPNNFQVAVTGVNGAQPRHLARLWGPGE
ncbi:MAG: hypothetical protein AAF944_05355 [Bacteroidota bacterium]